MTQRARPAFLRHLLTAYRLALAIVLLAALNLVSPAIAAEDGISLKLNSAKTVSEACETSFVLRNGLPHTLDRFQLDLYVFDTDGVIKSRSTIDLAPLRADKSTVLAFRLHAAPCASVSKVLVNDIPVCRAESGTVLDCLAGLSVSSRHSIEMAK